MDYKDFKLKLTSLIEDGYRDFVKKGIVTNYPLLGVRIPHLRELAKEVIKTGHVADFLSYTPQSFEETTTRGFVIAGLPYDEMKSYLASFIPQVDNWCTCDTFCNSLKSVREHRDDFLEQIDLLLDGSEFSARVALVCLLNHYVVPDYLAVIYDRVAHVANREEYYVKMAIAWLVAECFIKSPDETWGFLASDILPAWTKNKSISKIRDSYRVPPEVKQALLALRRMALVQ